MLSPFRDRPATASALLPGGVLSSLRQRPGHFIVRGRGGWCWDQYGNRFIDFICGYGPLVLGHCDAEVNQAVVEQMNEGMIFPSHTLLHKELLSVLRGLFPYADRTLLLKTGSEAVSAAIRLARAYTGRPKIIRCGFHGWHDGLMVPHMSWHTYEAHPPLQGIPAGILTEEPESPVVPWTGDDLGQLKELFRLHRPQVAALLLDPVQLREPIGEQLTQLRDMTRQEDALLILDEAKTGFRVSMTGVQGLYPVEPDMAIFSKGISNGFPLAVLIGRERILGLSSAAKIMGTYNGELLSVVAALKTISILQRPQSISRLWQTGQQFIEGINEIVNRRGLGDSVRAVPYRWPCMPYIWFHDHSERIRRLKDGFYRELCNGGVLLLPDHMNFVCLAHTKEDVGNALDAIDGALGRCLHKQEVTR